MEQQERDRILKEEPFATSNIPISMFQNDEGKFFPVIAMPRKETCYSCSDEPLETEEEFQKYCERAIAIYENAVELFKLLKEHKINHIYYFDSPTEYLKEAEAEKEAEEKAKHNDNKSEDKTQ
jgi:hypothetical protein